MASIAVDGQPLARTGRVIALDPGTSKTVLIDVTAEAGNVARTIVRLSREAARDTNARLSRLQLAGAQLTPNFDARVLEYQARLEANVNAVTLMASTESPAGIYRGRRAAAGKDWSGHRTRPGNVEDGHHRRDGRGRQRRADHRSAEPGGRQGHECEPGAPAAGGSTACTELRRARLRVPGAARGERQRRHPDGVDREPRGLDRGRRAAAGQDRAGHRTRPGNIEDGSHRRDRRGWQRRADHRQAEPGGRQGHECKPCAPAAGGSTAYTELRRARLRVPGAARGERQRRHPDGVDREPRWPRSRSTGSPWGEPVE